MTINMILFTVTIKYNRLSQSDYISIRQAENEMLDRKSQVMNKLF